MSKKDYELIASALAATYWDFESRMALDPEHVQFLDALICEFVIRLRAENPRFNERLFINACRKEGN